VFGENTIEWFAPDNFPAHVLVKSNLYDEYTLGNETVSKETVINFFVGRVLKEDTLPVYEPGTQAPNFIHVVDVVWACVRSAERLQKQLEAGETGVDHYMLASDEDPSVHAIAEQVQEIAMAYDLNPTVELVENPRSGETMVEDFTVDTTKTLKELGWHPEREVSAAIECRIEAKEGPGESQNP